MMNANNIYFLIFYVALTILFDKVYIDML